jgi:hypothetical protein
MFIQFVCYWPLGSSTFAMCSWVTLYLFFHLFLEQFLASWYYKTL